MYQLNGKSCKINGESYKSIPTSEFRAQARILNRSNSFCFKNNFWNKNIMHH